MKCASLQAKHILLAPTTKYFRCVTWNGKFTYQTKPHKFVKNLYFFFNKIYLILSTQGSGVKKWGGIMWEADRSELEPMKILYSII